MGLPILTLFIVPVAWDLLMGLQERLDRRRGRQRGASSPAGP